MIEVGQTFVLLYTGMTDFRLNNASKTFGGTTLLDHLGEL